MVQWSPSQLNVCDDYASTRLCRRRAWWLNANRLLVFFGRRPIHEAVAVGTSRTRVPSAAEALRRIHQESAPIGLRYRFRFGNGDQLAHSGFVLYWAITSCKSHRTAIWDDRRARKPANIASIVCAASFCIDGSTWLYVSIVTAMEPWPRRSWTTFG